MNHKWKDLEDGSGFEKCSKCGAFRKKEPNLQFTASAFVKKRASNRGKWLLQYSRKGSVRWTETAPECVSFKPLSPS